MMNFRKQTLQVFYPRDIDKPLYWVSDLAHWKLVFHTAGLDNERHEKRLATLISDKTVILKKYQTSSIENGNTEESKFIDNMRKFIQTLKLEKQEYQQCKQEYFQIVEDIRKHKDKWKKHVQSYDKQLKYVLKKLEKNAKRIEYLRKHYHKFKFLASKEATKARMSVKQNVTDDANIRHARAAAIAAQYRSSYEIMLENWNKMAADARLLSIEYETAFTERELAKGELVMSALERIRMPGKCQANTNGTTFRNDTIRDLIEHLATNESFYRNIECPKFQEYDESRNLANMYEDAKKELSFEEDGKITKDIHEELNRDHNVDIDEDSDIETEKELLSDEELNKILELKKKFQYFIVSKEYTKQNKTEINLKPGERVKQLLPPNEHGMAYGQVTHGILHKTKKGFYPVDHTKLFMTLNPEDDKKNKSKLKLAKKVQKQVKKMKKKEQNNKMSAAASASTSKVQDEPTVITPKKGNDKQVSVSNVRRIRDIVESFDFSDHDDEMVDSTRGHY